MMAGKNLHAFVLILYWDRVSIFVKFNDWWDNLQFTEVSSTNSFSDMEIFFFEPDFG